jgi:hypothetical protein
MREVGVELRIKGTPFDRKGHIHAYTRFFIPTKDNDNRTMITEQETCKGRLRTRAQDPTEFDRDVLSTSVLGMSDHEHVSRIKRLSKWNTVGFSPSGHQGSRWGKPVQRWCSEESE